MIQTVTNLCEKRQQHREKTFCKNTERSRVSGFPSVSEATHVAVCLQRGHQDVDEPEGEEQKEGEELGCPWAPQLSSWHAGTPAVEQHDHTHHRHDGKQGYGKGQGARVHLKHLAFGVPVNCRDGPRHANAQEHVHCVAACHVANGGVSVLVLDGSHFTGKCVYKQIVHFESDQNVVWSCLQK